MSARQPRTDDQYVIDSGLRLLKVMEALEGAKFEPVSIQRVQQRCGQGFTYDFCRRALITLKKAGFAAEQGGGWMVGPKLLKFSTRFNDLCLAAVAGGNSEISESGGA